MKMRNISRVFASTGFTKTLVQKRMMGFVSAPQVGSTAKTVVLVTGSFSGLIGLISIAPLDEFEKIEKKNTAYHRHLHPR